MIVYYIRVWHRKKNYDKTKAPKGQVSFLPVPLDLADGRYHFTTPNTFTVLFTCRFWRGVYS